MFVKNKFQGSCQIGWSFFLKTRILWKKTNTDTWQNRAWQSLIQILTAGWQLTIRRKIRVVWATFFNIYIIYKVLDCVLLFFFRAKPFCTFFFSRLIICKIAFITSLLFLNILLYIINHVYLLFFPIKR